MPPTRRRLLAAVAATGSLAGCLGDDGALPTTPTRRPETATETDPPDGTAATVGVGSLDELGDVLVGPDGLTLYMFDSDTEGAGASTCTGGCAEAWPPLTADGDPTAGEGVTADITTFEREDGTAQVAAGGWPLYHFADDEAPGDAGGQGVSDVWWVLRPDGTPVREADGTATEATDTETTTPTGAQGEYPDYDWAQLEGAEAVATSTITMAEFRFDPLVTTVRPGTTLTVVNEDSAGHTMTVPALDVDLRLDGGESGSVTVDRTGTFDFVCEFHPPDMLGRLLVSEDAPTPTADDGGDGGGDSATETPTEDSGGGGYPARSDP